MPMTRSYSSDGDGPAAKSGVSTTGLLLTIKSNQINQDTVLLHLTFLPIGAAIANKLCISEHGFLNDGPIVLYDDDE